MIPRKAEPHSRKPIPETTKNEHTSTPHASYYVFNIFVLVLLPKCQGSRWFSHGDGGIRLLVRAWGAGVGGGL